ncbi:MAG: hypothetical protein KJ587_00060 [Alphaproteobacteria bacterium]|nr:hypothetical protein [Alphaproteobacteria bacterium]
MLGYIVLIALQIIIGWFGKDVIAAQIPNQGALIDGIVDAICFAVIVWLVGLIGSLVLKSVGRPGTSTLVSALVGALIGAAVVIFVPAVLKTLPAQVDADFIPLAGAILGYLVRR